VEELLRRGHEVVASSANAGKAAGASWYGKVEYISLDLSGLDAGSDYHAFFGRPDAMIHLAWEGLPNYKAAFHVEENYPRHAALLENLIRHGLRDLTVVGTCLEYGMQEGMLREDMETHPGNPYAKAKDMLRQRLEALQKEYGFIFRWARLFYMYGEGQNPKSLFSQLEKAVRDGEGIFNMSGGEQVRDFLPVGRMAEYLVGVATQEEVTGIVNICSGNPVTVRALVEEFLHSKHASIVLNLGYYPYPDYEPMRFWGDNRKLLSAVKVL
jgi:dTDP-6-deoxy-L-talose 4-dehydrogenase (NAD+)